MRRIVRGDLLLLPVIQDRELADRIVSAVWVDRVALSKETAAGRFRDLDDLLIDLTQQVSNTVIHDVGVSNGITSLELLERFHARALWPTFYISDKFARCLCVQRGPVTRIYDSYGTLIQGRVGILLADPQASWRFAVSRLLFFLLARAKPRLSQSKVVEMLLYSRSVKDALEAGAMTHLDYDVFSSYVDIKFDVVRCMNTITRKYFTRDRIRDALSNLGRSLKPSGLLLVGRTLPNARNDATVFRLVADRFVPLLVVNEGADIHDIVVDLRIQHDVR
jgi:hypothetical protein